MVTCQIPEGWGCGFLSVHMSVYVCLSVTVQCLSVVLVFMPLHLDACYAYDIKDILLFQPNCSLCWCFKSHLYTKFRYNKTKNAKAAQMHMKSVWTEVSRRDLDQHKCKDASALLVIKCVSAWAHKCSETTGLSWVYSSELKVEIFLLDQTLVFTFRLLGLSFQCLNIHKINPFFRVKCANILALHAVYYHQLPLIMAFLLEWKKCSKSSAQWLIFSVKKKSLSFIVWFLVEL